MNLDRDRAHTSFRPGELQLTGDTDGHLVGSSCGSCGAHYFPTREVCARCLSEEMDTVALSGRGVLYTFTVIRQSTPAFEVPYILGYVDLPERVRVMGQITGCEPEDVSIGMELEMSVEPFTEDNEGNQMMGYRFHPVGGEA